MRQVIKDRRLVDDDWVYAGKEEPGDAVRIALPLAEYLSLRSAQPAVTTRGVWLAPADDIVPLVPWLGSVPLIAVEFASSGDGRGYTHARLLRDRFGYKGELRAIGAVRVDQIYFLARCGFDTFELLAGESTDVAIAQLHRFSVAYQSSTGELVHPRRRYDAGSSAS